jgi:hypothetical protein
MTAVPRPNDGLKWRENTGTPPKCKRVRVVLAWGREPKYDENPMSAAGWAVDTTRWSLLGEPWDVAWFLPL